MSGEERPARLDEAARERGVITGQLVYMEHLPPEVLRRFDEAVPGSARELLNNTLAESEHRRDMDRRLLALKSRALGFQAWRSLYGQTIGFLVCLACVGGAVYLAAANPAAWQVPVALAAIPTAAVIRAFVLSPARREDRPPPPPDNRD